MGRITWFFIKLSPTIIINNTIFKELGYDQILGYTMRFSFIFFSLSFLLIAGDFVDGAKLQIVPSLTEKESSLDVRAESLKGCSMSSLNKCYGSLPPDGSRPNNLLEEIGQVSDAQTCQSFCKDLYRGSCAWFIFDRTTNDCKLFSGSLDDLRADCKEVGYAKEPNHSSCDTVFASNSTNGCYNFREDYCRFEFSLLENLEDIETLSECQLACQYINNCSYFVHDAPTKICKLNTIASSRPICDIIHGTPEPDFNTCVNDGNLDWASNENNPQTSQSSSNDASPVDCLWGSYGEWSNCSKTCGGGERTRTRNETTPASNGGQECDGDSTETENCNQEECPLVIPARAYTDGCVPSTGSMENLFDDDESTSCSTDAYGTDYLMIGFSTSTTASGLKFTMEGYTGTVWLRFRSSNGEVPNDYNKYKACIGGSWWGYPISRGSDAEIKVTSGKATYEVSFGATMSVDCLGFDMSDAHGNPKGKYDPKPKIYEMALV